jgi:hypothetical protein
MTCENDYSIPEEICEEVTSDGFGIIPTDHGSTGAAQERC